jgi:hypothetical protein
MPPKKKVNTKKPWTDLHQKKLIWLYNWYTNNYDSQANIETFIDKNKRKLMSLILNNKDWSIASKEALLFMIARYLYNIKNNDRYVKLYAQSAYNLLQEKNKLEGLNELDQKELENHRSIEFLNNCLEVHKEKEKENIIEHFKHLLLMMLIKQPSLRTSFYSSAKFLRLLTDNNKKDNYVYINKKGKLKVYYIVNTDKASNYKVYNMNKDLSKIQLDNQELVNFINYSFDTYPREYLFEKNGKKLSDATLLKYLRDVTKTPLINFDMIRSAYITYFYEHNKTFNKREELSKQMRHSQHTASKNYLKVSNTDATQPEEEINNLKKTIIQLKNNIDNCQNKLGVFQNEPESENKFNKKKKDIIYLLNKGKTSKPETIKKYNILYDDKNKLYY